MRRIRKGRLISAIVIALLMIGIIISVGWYYNSIQKVNNDDTLINITVDPGNTYYSISNLLYNNKLIKSELGYKIYLKLNEPSKELTAGTYQLSSNMGVKKIVDVLSNKGNAKDLSGIKLTITEGKNIRSVAKTIAENTSYSVDDVYIAISDPLLLERLIDKYWFLTDDVLDSGIFYALEGYLYPDTYIIKDESSIEDIITVMLDEMEKKLEPYKTQIESSSYSIHELLTLASIVESEAANKEDRKMVAGVFYNRLNANMTLGSDVTTYYAVQKDFVDENGEINSLTTADLNTCNGYNTRSNCVRGLPIGPISNVSLESIEAVLNPTNSDYYYFVADCNKKTYFAKTDTENIAKKNELVKQGVWCE